MISKRFDSVLAPSLQLLSPTMATSGSPTPPLWCAMASEPPAGEPDGATFVEYRDGPTRNLILKWSRKLRKRLISVELLTSILLPFGAVDSLRLAHDKVSEPSGSLRAVVPG